MEMSNYKDYKKDILNLSEYCYRHIDVWFFIVFAITTSFFINWLYAFRNMVIWPSMAQFSVGIMAFFLQTVIRHKPFIELYSKNYPYRRLKPYGIISAFVFFEFLLMWGLYTKQLLNREEELFLISIVFAGVIVYYYAVIRMKISLRFLLLAIFIPTIGTGASLGLGSYFKILKFVAPMQRIGNIVFYNTIYWVLLNIFIHLICEEPAFRGYLIQRLVDRGETFAILVSSACFAIWYIPFTLFSGMGILYTLFILLGYFIMGGIFALLFIKGRNLLISAICYGIINGLGNSLFGSSSINPGIRQYLVYLVPKGEPKFLLLWFICLSVGLILLTIIPRKGQTTSTITSLLGLCP